MDSKENRPPPSFHENVLYYTPASYVRGAAWLCDRIKSDLLRRWLLPKPGHLGIFRAAVKVIEVACKVVGQESRQSRTLVLGEGDMLLLPDACWHNAGIWEPARAGRAKGAFVVTVVYDLIPLTHPQFVAPGLSAVFRNYLREAITSSDLIVAISQTIRDQLRQKLPKIFPDVKEFPEIEAFSLGADFASAKAPVRRELIDLFSPTKQATPYITVSTFEPRKNHGYTLQAIETLWSRGLGVRLMFVGMRGGMCNDLLEKIETHPEFGKRLFKYHDLSDSELAYCYQRARGTISSSFVEGFGLPIVESLWHGRKTFAGDTPIYREVGGSYATYFSLSSPESLSRAIAHWENELANGATLEQPHVTPTSWRQSTELLLQKAQDAYGRSGAAGNAFADHMRQGKTAGDAPCTKRAA